MPADIVVIGSFVVGVTVRLPRMPHPGETLVADLFDLGPGGKGTNMAVAATRQDREVVLVACLGDDLFADIAYQLYQAEDINTHHIIRRTGESTAVGLVYLQENGENTIGVYRGANWTLRPDEIEAVLPDVMGAEVLLTQLEIPDDAVSQAVSLGRQQGLTVILNPAPARILDKSILRHVDILTPNEGEARILVGLEPNDDSVSVEEVGRRLLGLGVQTAIITMGGKGCLLVQAETVPVHVPAYPVETVDTVGAGDAFNGGLAVALAEGRTMEDAAGWANVTAALSTRQVGAVDALPTYDEVQHHFNNWYITRGGEP